MEKVNKEKIVIDDHFSLLKWCERLDCTEEDLLKAVHEIGNSARAVDDYLTMNKRKLSSGMDL